MDEFSDQIGGRLQEAREAAGLSVDDIMFQTRIPRSVIIALEAGDFTVFSSPTYAKSFLSQYSSFLNVEAGLWLNALQPASFISGETVSPLWVAAGAGKEERSPERGPGNGWFSALSLFVLTCVVVFAAIKGYEFFDARFGTEVNMDAGRKGDAGLPPDPPPRSRPPEPVQIPPPIPEVPDSDLNQPAPRAIIVR